MITNIKLVLITISECKMTLFYKRKFFHYQKYSRDLRITDSSLSENSKNKARRKSWQQTTRKSFSDDSNVTRQRRGQEISKNATMTFSLMCKIIRLDFFQSFTIFFNTVVIMSSVLCAVSLNMTLLWLIQSNNSNLCKNIHRSEPLPRLVLYKIWKLLEKLPEKYLENKNWKNSIFKV